ncbi:MAG: hypothetical protein IJK42_00630 [Prevotella sp.]|nr:hypothetical protein [Prevotella sp.]
MKRTVLLMLLSFAYSLISAQDRHIILPEQPVVKNNIAEKDNGYWCAVEFGGGSTVMDNMKNIAVAGGSFTNGYRFNQYLKVGLGVGVLYYPNNKNVRASDNHFSVPVYFNARGNILSDDIRRTVPFWSANIGTSVSDGFFFTPAFGLRIGEMRSAFLISIAYTYRRLDAQPDKVKDYHGALLKLGYEF